MLILGIDLEGMNENLVENGVNLSKDRITEIGAILWDTEFNQPVRIYSELIDETDRIPISEEIEELTGINDKMLETYGLKGEEIKMALDRLSIIMKKADYVMAHNGPNYDIPMLRAIYERFKTPMPDMTWIDSKTDIEFPRRIISNSLAALEHAHGFINPFPHRAVTDVLSMLKVSAHYDFERIAELASSKKVRIIADLSAPNWKSQKDVDRFNKIKSKVSRARFSWNPGNKTWSKVVHKILIDEGKLGYDFEWYLE
jgi:DNA polymerase-3 subunit epsilon